MTKVSQILLLVLSFMTLSFAVSAQSMKITGEVTDTTIFKPVRDASVVIIRLSDSVIVDYTRTDMYGKFSFDKLKIDTVEVLITHPKYSDISYYIVGSKQEFEFNIDNIIVSENMKAMNEVVIFASKDPVYYRGDTLVFVADSFDVKTNAVVEDLLKKLPGVEVGNDGGLKFQGKEVAKVLVDGDEFFGSDHLVATRNLDARAVENVEIYEKEIENAQDGSTETVQVMNLKLKDEAKRGYFGRVAGGTDFQNFYEAEALASRFNGKQKLSGYVQGSNTPNSGFNWQDSQQYGFDNERQGILSEDDEWMWYGNSEREGLPQSFRSGVYYTDELSEKLAVSFNYGYKDRAVEVNTLQSRQTFINDTTSFSVQDDNKGFDRSFSHALNASLTYKIDSLTTLEIKPQLTYNKTIQRNKNNSSFLDENFNMFSETLMDNENESDDLKFSNVTRLTKLFAKKNRKLELTHQIEYEDKNSFGYINNRSRDIIGDSIIDAFDQRKVGRMNGIGHLGRVVYWEPLTKFWRVEMEYQLNYFETVNGVQSLNADVNGVYSVLDAIHSNDFENRQMVNMIGAFARYDKGKHMVRFGMRARKNQTSNFNVISLDRFTQNVDNLLPSVNYRFKPKPSLRLNARYSTDASLPQISQLQPLRDNTNPNSYRIGNAELVPSYSHNLNVNFNSWNGLKSSYVYGNIYGNYTNNDFSTETSFDANGISTIKTINVDGNYSTGFYAGMGRPIIGDINARFNFNGNYRNMNNVINGMANTTLNRSLGANFTLDYYKEDSTGVDVFEVNLNFGTNYTVPKSTLALGSNQPYWTHTASFDFGVELPFKFRLESDVNYSMFTRRTAGFNTNILLWNASINKRFLKGENLVLSVQANDILNQNTRISRNIMSNMIIDSRTQIISRYFLIKLTYNFKNKIKEKDKDETFN